VRLAPRSLFGRLVLILLGGLILAQLATAYINLAERDQLLYRAGGMRLAQQISDIVKLLDSLPAAERRKVVAVFNAPPLAVSLDRPRMPARAGTAESDFAHSMFTAVLRFALGEDAQVNVVRRRAAGYARDDRDVNDVHDAGPRLGARHGPRSFPGRHVLHRADRAA